MSDDQPTLPGMVIAEDKLTTISLLARKLEQLQDEAERLESELKKVVEEGRNIEEQLLPDLMNALSLSEVVTTSGKRLSIRTEYHPSIPKARYEEAMKWLRDHNMGGIIKTGCVVEPEFQEQLQKEGVPYTLKEAIHPQTLKALVKEQCETPDSKFPEDLFGVFKVSRAHMKG